MTQREDLLEELMRFAAGLRDESMDLSLPQQIIAGNCADWSIPIVGEYLKLPRDKKPEPGKVLAQITRSYYRDDLPWQTVSEIIEQAGRWKVTGESLMMMARVHGLAEKNLFDPQGKPIEQLPECNLKSMMRQYAMFVIWAEALSFLKVTRRL